MDNRILAKIPEKCSSANIFKNNLHKQTANAAFLSEKKNK